MRILVTKLKYVFFQFDLSAWVSISSVILILELILVSVLVLVLVSILKRQLYENIFVHFLHHVLLEVAYDLSMGTNIADLE